ncbi:beta-glucosidase family protein [Parasphingorhabdus cellanae]|uniref:Glycoside hydrolase family 3 C-terminal domain-containing protein n=1 Tax=Parasphingorhabdus cellanae TaxID=2806553 RepID=A0ABX7T669_9SPHN|nr:glycoside hydrolase family 3 C-terminal domain-containing protein [Parasphingorhabdus cellanae]QTD57085.1 glycoside hydrolase family 3 C-terminal domain-containing protein [Parasphingorhabdus cellanae]
MTTSKADHALIEKELDDLIPTLSLKEKVAMMSGKDFYKYYFTIDNRQFGVRAYNAGGGCEQLDLAPLSYADGPRGVRMPDGTTCFPVSMARGASWDVDLERRIGVAMGVEARALGLTLLSNVCINLLRHPAWGRSQETYSEDPYHLGEMGAALAEGTQSQNVMATVKHFALNSIENARFKVDVTVNERVLREVYLPHFKRVVDAGCATVMSAYNQVNGHYCAHNEHLLRDILKREWGFEGFVHSDWVKGVYGADAAEAGLDIENPEPTFFGEDLVYAVKSGETDESVVDEAVRRILRMQLRFSRATDPQSYSKNDIGCSAHAELAQEAAEKSMVLLKNDDALPLARDGSRIAVLGKLADKINLGDHGSSNVTPPYAITPFAGIEKHVAKDVDLQSDFTGDPASSATLAANSDVAIVVVGYTYFDEGEFIPGDVALEEVKNEEEAHRGGDRNSLRLPPADVELIRSVAETETKMIVCVMGGGAIMMDEWSELADAILMIWYPGMEGGTALARILFGDVSPSGKLPFAIPADESDLPFFDKHADDISYGMYHGYTLFDRNDITPALPFGFGLSYTKFTYGEPSIERTGEQVHIRVEITNSGAMTGAEIAQLYVGFENSKIDRPKKLLRGFERLELAPGESAIAAFTLDRTAFTHYDEETNNWRLDPVPFDIFVGSSSTALTSCPAQLIWPE